MTTDPWVWIRRALGITIFLMALVKGVSPGTYPFVYIFAAILMI